jgi:hypothetical protein
MSVLGTLGICWLGLSSAVFTALATRKSRPGLRTRQFNWSFGGGGLPLPDSRQPADKIRDFGVVLAKSRSVD